MPVHEITSALSGVDLRLWNLHVDDELGRPFSAELETLTEKADITADSLLGTSLTVSITKPDGNSKRFFNGLVSRFAYMGRRGRYHVYAVTLRPWLWFLTRTTDCRIFQHRACSRPPEPTTRTFIAKVRLGRRGEQATERASAAKARCSKLATGGFRRHDAAMHEALSNHARRDPTAP